MYVKKINKVITIKNIKDMAYIENVPYSSLSRYEQAQYHRELALHWAQNDYKEQGLKAFAQVTEMGENFLCGKSPIDRFYFIIKPNGELIDRAFNYVGVFREGSCVVAYEQPCGKHSYFEYCENHIDTNGKFIFDHNQFVWIGNFVNGIANVCLDGGTKNYIDKKGNILFPQYPNLTNTFEFSCGWGCIQREYKEYNYINAEGKLLLSEWVDRAWDFEDNKARVIINGVEKFIEI
jgi:hypothetical protein